MISNLSAKTTFSTIEEVRSFFLPYIVIYGLIAFAYAIIGLVVTLNLNYRIAKSYEEGNGTRRAQKRPPDFAAV